MWVLLQQNPQVDVSEACHLAAIIRATIQMPYDVVKSLKLILRLGTWLNFIFNGAIDGLLESGNKPTDTAKLTSPRTFADKKE